MRDVTSDHATAARPRRVLVADAPTAERAALSHALAGQGFQVIEASSAAELREHLDMGLVLVLVDVTLPGLDAAELLRALAEGPPILLTQNPLAAAAVHAVSQGGVAAIVPGVMQDGWPVSGSSPAISKVLALVAKVAKSPSSTVLITGESGTGKDLFARTIHEISNRASRPFVNITCSALPEQLLESELFGHERGAFTDAKHRKSGLLEQAAGGTVFLDEIGEMSGALQAKLLRFLEERAFRPVGGSRDIRPDVRVIAATHRDLKRAVHEGTFRADLFYRLSVVHIRLPPLRERRGDIGVLATQLIDRFNVEFDKRVNGLSRAASSLLETYAWPGNVRELRNSIERAMLLAEGATLEIEHFDDLDALTRAADGSYTLPPLGVDLSALERSLLVQALARTGGNQTHAAGLLGLGRDQLRYRMTKHGLLRRKSDPTVRPR